MTAQEGAAADPDQPTAPADAVSPTWFRVESGNPTPEDLAVLTLVLAAATSGGDEPAAPKPVTGWGSPASRMRSIGRPGFGAWRAEAFVR